MQLYMDMYLYNYKDSENMDLITAWNPDEEQWWITGFNPECKGEKATLEIGRGFLIARKKVCNHSFLIMLF